MDNIIAKLEEKNNFETINDIATGMKVSFVQKNIKSNRVTNKYKRRKNLSRGAYHDQVS